MGLPQSTQMGIVFMGMNGLYARTIARAVRDYFGNRVSVGQVYYVLKQRGVSLRAYRKGESTEAELIIKKAFKQPGRKRKRQ